MTVRFRGIALRGLLVVGLLGALQTLGNDPPSPPTVNITATSDPNAAEVGPDTGTFTVTRTGPVTLPLVVYFQSPTGTAQNGVDYQTLPTYVTILAGATSATVTLTPILDLNSSEGNETVVLTLAANANYWVGAPSSATVTIADVPADSDSDDLPDAWEWWHFGSLSQGANDDYDQDNADNLTEYNAGSDPNTIVFDVQFANLRVNANTANGTFNVLRGGPAKMAVLVDSSNFASATWLPYSANFSVTLGSTDARHDVWIGLKGRADTSEATWGDWRLTRDTAPPVIILTNPLVTTVSQPILQLQGYSPEPLSGLRYDMTNAASSLTNLQGFVSKQWFDTNLFDLTTNWFECVDIGLTNGTNLITLRATDLAGNVSTNIYAYVLDYSSDTVPPALTVYWPQNGSLVSGTNFALRGWLDDATATVSAQIVGTNGVTNLVSGLSERDGLLWVQDLPLGGGTNTLSLTMTDAAGNVSATNLFVVQSGVLLAIDDLAAVDLNQPRITVNGTINVSDHKIWVNGMEVTNVSGGTWYVEGVPVNEGGTAVIQAVAIPNTDYGGNGTGGSGGSGATMQIPGNPTSPDGKMVEAGASKPPEVVMIHYCKDWTFTSVELDEYPLTDEETEHIRWDRAKEGSWTYDSCFGAVNGDNYYYGWNDAQWGANGVGTVAGNIHAGPKAYVCGVRVGDQSPYTLSAAWLGEYCEGEDFRIRMQDFLPWSAESVTRSARTLYELRTGGKKGTGRGALFELTASATGHANFFYPEVDPNPVSYPIANQSIALGDLGTLDSDGALYKALGDGETRIVTPIVAGSRYYRCGKPEQSKVLVALSLNASGTNLSTGDNLQFPSPFGNPVNQLGFVIWNNPPGCDGYHYKVEIIGQVPFVPPASFGTFRFAQHRERDNVMTFRTTPTVTETEPVFERIQEQGSPTAEGKIFGIDGPGWQFIYTFDYVIMRQNFTTFVEIDGLLCSEGLRWHSGFALTNTFVDNNNQVVRQGGMSVPNNGLGHMELQENP